MNQNSSTQPLMPHFEPLKRYQLMIALVVMCSLVAASNYLVQPQFHINDWLTFGAVTYPITFLVTDLLNRRFGPKSARRIVYWGFAAALIVSVYLSTPRIALASGSAFLMAHLLDIVVFDRLRQKAWWLAPLLAGILASTIDTFIFFGVAFIATGVPWITLSLGDLAIKLSLSILMLAPFRALMWNLGAAKFKKKIDINSEGQAI